MEQGEEMDTKKDQEREDSSGGGQRTQAKLPPTQPGSQKPHPVFGGGGGCRILVTACRGGRGG
jgi:hypothetical protein